MADKRAQQIISLRDREHSKQSNFRNLWQDTADLTYPRENQIVDKKEPGERKTQKIYDVTAVMESQNMAAGLAHNLVPPGQKFFSLKPSNRDLQDVDDVKRYLNKATEVVHDELFASNFMLQLTETLRSLVVFGTGNLYSEYQGFLNFKDYAIGTYQIMENSAGRVDTVILTLNLTARQATQEFSNPGKEASMAASDPDRAEEIFEYIHIIRPRARRNPNLQDNQNMPIESLYVSVKDVEVVDEGGFDEFPYSVPRWLKSSTEKYGRGQGTEILPQTQVCNLMMRDLTECGNKWNNPAREILDSFEGEFDASPDANNYVQQIGSIKAVDDGIKGNFPITKDILMMQQEIIKDAFFASAFAPLTGLTGDRRTTTEIRQRVLESFKKIGSPIGRLQSELFTPTIERVVMLLLRNGKLQPPPPELQGQEFKIEYTGPLSLALRSGETEAAQQWISILGAVQEMNPAALDNIDWDDAIRRMARDFGVNEEDIASMEEVQAKREKRQAEINEQKGMQMAEAAAKAYPGSTKAPEPGSPAGQLMGA